MKTFALIIFSYLIQQNKSFNESEFRLTHSDQG